MAIEDAGNKVLEHLKKEGERNTFRLARELKIDRHKLLNIIKELQEKQAIELKYGNVRFLKFPSKKERQIKVKKALSRPKKEVKHIAKKAMAESKKFREQAGQIEKLEDTIKALRQKAKTPKIVRRTKIKEIIKRVPVKSRKLEEQDEHIEELEKRIKELHKKLRAKPKIITRKIEVPKIITKTIVKRIIKKVPVEVIKKVLIRVKEREAKKFKLPKINLPNIKNIQRLERPEFLEQKITAKVNFSALNKNIQQLNVPEMLRNN